MITQKDFLEKYNISEELFKSAGISWESLCEIYKDYDNKNGKYEKILKEFLDEYFQFTVNNSSEKAKDVRIHSFRARVKKPEHLLEKIIRKKQDNCKKYNKLDLSNYEKMVTDLIGIRCLILFKTDWIYFHRYILSQFENDEKNYIKDPIRDFDNDKEHNYIAEPPKVHIRNGDAREIYHVIGDGNIIDGKVYRSVHYIIKYKGIYLEIQVRTLFEEGWGEVDHTIIYPYHRENAIFKEYTELLNRLSGLADEMGSFFYRLKSYGTDAFGGSITAYECEDVKNACGIKDKTKEEPENETVLETPEDCVKSVLDE